MMSRKSYLKVSSKSKKQYITLTFMVMIIYSQDVYVVGGFNQNNNESFNQLVWKISPISLNSSSTIVEIVTYVAPCVFNECTLTLLIDMNALGINC